MFETKKILTWLVRVKGYNHLSDTLYQGHSIGSERWSYKKESLEAFSMAIKTAGLKKI